MIRRRTQVGHVHVPAPFVPVIPEPEILLKSCDSIVKQLFYFRVCSFDIQIVKAQQSGHATIQNAGSRTTRHLRVEGVPVKHGANAAGLFVQLEDSGGTAQQLEKLGAPGDSPGANQGADDQSLCMGRNPGRFEVGGTDDVVEFHRPYDCSVTPNDCVVLQPGDLFQKYVEVSTIVSAQIVSQIH